MLPINHGEKTAPIIPRLNKKPEANPLLEGNNLLVHAIIVGPIGPNANPEIIQKIYIRYLFSIKIATNILSALTMEQYRTILLNPILSVILPKMSLPHANEIKKRLVIRLADVIVYSLSKNRKLGNHVLTPNSELV